MSRWRGVAFAGLGLFLAATTLHADQPIPSSQIIPTIRWSGTSCPLHLGGLPNLPVPLYCWLQDTAQMFLWDGSGWEPLINAGQGLTGATLTNPTFNGTITGTPTWASAQTFPGLSLSGSVTGSPTWASAQTLPSLTLNTPLAVASGGTGFGDVRVTNYSLANLPAAGTAGRVARLTDGGAAGAVVVDDGISWNCGDAKSQKLIIVTCPPYNAKGDGTTNDRAALASADTAATTTGTIVIPRGMYKISSNLTLSAALRFENGAMLSPDMGTVVTITGQIAAGAYQIFTTGAGTVAFPTLTQLPAAGVSPTWWGAKLDASTNDTVAVNAAIAALGTSSNGARLVIDGRILTNDLTIPARDTWLVIDFSGQWYLTTTLTLPAKTAIIGKTGYSPSQFQQMPNALIRLFPQQAVPVIKTDTGAAPRYLANVKIAASTGKSIYIQSDQTTLDNVSVVTPGVSASEEGIYVENAQFIVLRRCQSHVTNGIGLASLHLTAKLPQLGPALGVGELYVDEFVIAGKGILWDQSTAASGSGFSYFRNVVYEAGQNEFLTLDASLGSISGVEVDRVTAADVVSVPSLLKATGSVSNITIRNSDLGTPIVDSATNINGLYVETTAISPVGNPQWQIGTAQHEYVINKGGAIDAPILTGPGPMSPSIIPFVPENVVVDPTAWATAAGTATVTTGLTGPDGSTLAGRISSSSGTSNRTILSKAVTPAVGDWIIAGAWMRADSTATPFETRVKFLDATQINGLANLQVLTDALRRVVGNTWTPVVVAGKVTSIGGGATTLQFNLGAGVNQDVAVFMPFLFYVPVSSGYSAAEIIRWKRSLMTVPSGICAACLGSYQGVAFGPTVVNGQLKNDLNLTELTTIAAAATTTTSIQIPANAVVYGVSVRVTTVIPTCATFTVTAGGKTFDTAAVSCAATSTDPGTAVGPVYFASATAITITPNLQPAANTGRVRTTIHYYTITPPTS